MPFPLKKRLFGKPVQPRRRRDGMIAMRVFFDRRRRWPASTDVFFASNFGRKNGKPTRGICCCDLRKLRQPKKIRHSKYGEFCELKNCKAMLIGLVGAENPPQEILVAIEENHISRIVFQAPNCAEPLAKNWS